MNILQRLYYNVVFKTFFILSVCSLSVWLIFRFFAEVSFRKSDMIMSIVVLSSPFLTLTFEQKAREFRENKSRELERAFRIKNKQIEILKILLLHIPNIKWTTASLELECINTLNLIPLEFKDYPDIISLHKKFSECVNMGDKNPNFITDRFNLYCKIIGNIATLVDYKFESDDTIYYPLEFINREINRKTIEQGWVKIFNNSEAFPIKITNLNCTNCGHSFFAHTNATFCGNFVTKENTDTVKKCQCNMYVGEIKL